MEEVCRPRKTEALATAGVLCTCFGAVPLPKRPRARIAGMFDGPEVMRQGAPVAGGRLHAARGDVGGGGGGGGRPNDGKKEGQERMGSKRFRRTEGERPDSPKERAYSETGSEPNQL